MKRLVIDGYGKYIGTSGERIIVKEKNKIIAQELPEDLRMVVLAGKCSISSDAIIKLARAGTDVIVVDPMGKVVSRLSFGMFRTVKTRREQYLGYYDQRGVEIAKIVILSKMYNQRYVLYTYGKRREGQMELFREYINRIDQEITNVNRIRSNSIDSVREKIMGAEGRASQMYWNGIKQIMPEWLNFHGRTGRGATDLLNSALNYGYALLEGEVSRGIHFAGLDPYGGFLHADRPGKPSLTLDIMEMFRQQCVDRVIFSLITKKVITEKNRGFENDIKKVILKEILSKFEEYVRVGGVKIRWTDLILERCRDVAKFLRKEKKTLEPFYLRW